MIRSRLAREAAALAGLVALAFTVLRLPPWQLGAGIVAGTDAQWIRWLRDTEPGTAIAWLPFAPGGDACEFEPTARMMVIGLGMDHPLVNGYSNYFPGRIDRTAHDTRTLPDPRALQRLRGVGTRWIVSPHDGPLSELDAATLVSLGLEPAMDDATAGITVYRLEPVPGGDGS